MLCSERKLRTPLKYAGGKHYLARRIIAEMEPTDFYAEDFCGGFSVGLNRRPSKVEVATDLHEPVIHFWRILRDRPGDLVGAAWELPYTQETFDGALGWLGSADELERALGFLVRNRFSRGAQGKSFAWSDRLRGKSRPGGPIPGDANAWDTCREEMPAVAARIQNVEFGCADALDEFERYDSRRWLVYRDCPYLHETRTSTDLYTLEMTREQHVRLLEQSVRSKARILISGYDSSLYREYLHGWTCIGWDMPNHQSQAKTKERRVECLWKNF